MTLVLNSFEPNAPFHVSVQPSLRSDKLIVEWHVRGPLPALEIRAAPQRADKLWLNTVFEVFGRSPNSQAYWETNLSPYGDWNAYRFDAYRIGMREASDVSVVSCEWLERSATQWHFTAQYAIPAHSELELGFAAIIYESMDVSLSWHDKIGPYHFAVRHALDKPDFHAPEGFSVVLSSSTP